MINDTHELRRLADDFDTAADRIMDRVAEVTGDSLARMQREAKLRVSGHSHIPHLARSFTHDVHRLGSTVVGEVGAEHSRLQGKLDVFIEYGSPTSRGIAHWLPAMDREVPVWIRNLEDACAREFE